MSIFYKAVLDVVDEMEETPSDVGYHETEEEVINKKLLDAFADQLVNALTQIDTLNAETVAYVAYDLQTMDGNNIHVREDIYDVFEKSDCGVQVNNVNFYEISAYNYRKCLDRAGIRGSLLNQMLDKRLHIEYTKDYYDTNYFMLTDYMVEEKINNKKSAKEELRRLLPDDKFSDEIDRIFYSKHPNNEFYGIPCHYKISVASDAVADDMINLLVDCLYINKRILSRRVTKIDNIKGRIANSEETLKQMFKAAQGSTVAIILNGDVATEEQYASSYHQVSDILEKYVKKNAGDVLFIFVENTAHPGFAKQLLGKVDEELDIIEIQEGVGHKREALAYFKTLLSESRMEKYFDDNDVIFQRGKCYSVTQVRSAFNKWRKERLKDRVYQAYNAQNLALKVEKDKEKKGSAYEELNAMIGLTDVKVIVNDIIAAYKVQKMRNEFYDSKNETSRHMIFTGSPGTAKTTVARLLTEIMKENGLLKTGAFVECGRADLVGRYVGWTAQIVKEKFRDAQGGVLFIDEAYSLVDASNSFGAEAINTIVQEMENRRGDVIVIFAGYPDKMKEFLNQNEGLRSRIAFHVNFPNYSPEELMGIMEKIVREMLFELKGEDFDTNIAKQYAAKRACAIGFTF